LFIHSFVLIHLDVPKHSIVTDMKLTPFWTDNATTPHNLTAQQPEQADVAVIGSGYTGLHAAYSLAKSGANVVVLEANSVGWGASSRNGGMVNPGLKLAAPELFRHYGAELGGRLWRWSMSAIDFVEQFIRDQAIDCNYARHGQIVLAYKPQHFTTLRHEVEWHHRELGDIMPQVVGPAELHTR
jgi:glycine/D-amino acid oxidase-like deaminating enzyme